MRLQRLQHVELLWVGSQWLTFRVNNNGKTISRRTQSLTWLSEAIRLKSLKVYLRESAKEVMRRKSEPRGVIQYMANRTCHQPNFRLYRSLRELQGLDYILTLRGLKEVDFFDFDRWLTRKEIVGVHDWTFVMDVKNSVTREKTTADRIMAQIRNLAPNFMDFSLGEVEWVLLEREMMEAPIEEPTDTGLPGNGYVPVGLLPIVIEDSDTGSDSSDGEGGTGENSDTEMVDAPSIDLTTDSDID